MRQHPASVGHFASLHRSTWVEASRRRCPLPRGTTPQSPLQHGSVRWCEAGTAEWALTQAVVSIVGEHEAVVAGAPVVPWYVDAFMDTAPVVIILTLIRVWKRRLIMSLQHHRPACVGGCI